MYVHTMSRVGTGCIQQITLTCPQQTATQFQAEVEAEKNTANPFGLLCGTTQGLLAHKSRMLKGSSDCKNNEGFTKPHIRILTKN